MTGLFNPDKSINFDYVPAYKDNILEWYKNEQAKYLKGIRGLPAAHVGVYTILIHEMYDAGEAMGQDVERLARMCGCTRAAFIKITNDLVDSGRLIRLRTGFWDEKVEDVFKKRCELQKNNSAAGTVSAEKRKEISKPVQHMFNSRRTRADRIEKIEGGGLEDNPPPERATREKMVVVDPFVLKIWHAVGMSGSPPGPWAGEKAIALVEKWKARGLGEYQIIEIAKQSRKIHQSPPATPQALDQFMIPSVEMLTPAKSRDEMQSATVDRHRMWAEAIREGRYVPPSALNSTDIAQMVHAGLVTPDQFRAAGFRT